MWRSPLRMRNDCPGATAAIVCYLVVALVERLATPWYISMREGGA